MSAATQTIYTEDKYLQMEELADYKSEYFQGEVFMMAEGTPNHNKIKENVSGEIYSILKKGNPAAAIQVTSVFIFLRIPFIAIRIL